MTFHHSGLPLAHYCDSAQVAQSGECQEGQFLAVDAETTLADLGIDVVNRIHHPIRTLEPTLTFRTLAPQPDLCLDPTKDLIRRRTRGSMGKTHSAHGAIFFRYLRVASTLGVPTSSKVAAACRLSEERVVKSN